MVGVSGTGVIATAMPTVLGTKRHIDMELYNLAQDLAR
jgi:hypothetical protein